VGIFVLVHVWLLWITRQMRRESEASLAECRRVEARIAALAAEALGRPRP
jgi:hypothetical protein